MLHQFLQTIQAGELQSLFEISRSMNISLGMAQQIAKDLSSKGYLQEIGADCDEQQSACSDCSVNSGCHVSVSHWFLTEKGKAAIQRSTIEK